MKFAIAALLLLQSSLGFSCTVFESPANQGFVISHNFDWYPMSVLKSTYPNRGVLVLNAAGMHKVGQLYENPTVTPADWTSAYRSVTFSTSGAEFPFGGFNEKKLFVGILQLNDAVYPNADARPGVSVTQFVQYMLDLKQNVNEVVTAAASEVRPYSSLKMHYLACDPVNGCVVIQYTKDANGNPVLNHYQTSDSSLTYPVLTNSLYPNSVAAAASCAGIPCDNPDSSLRRFATAVKELGGINSSTPYLDQAFKIQNDVAQINQSSILTFFQVGYDPAHSQVFFRKTDWTNPSQTAAAYDFVTVDFEAINCNTIRKYIEIVDKDPKDRATHRDLSGAWQDLVDNGLEELLNFGTTGDDKLGHARSNGRFPFDVTKCTPTAPAPLGVSWLAAVLPRPVSAMFHHLTF